MYSIWCEWDMGWEFQLFKTEEAALAYAEDGWNEEELECSFEQALADGLVGTREYEVHE